MTKKEYNIPPSHPRYISLQLREAIADGVAEGLSAPEGLIAHGRGEAFDYLLGECTLPPAITAIRAAGATMLLAKHPVISVNGNVAALAPEHVIELSDLIKARIEVNIFHYSKMRSLAIINRFQELGAEEVLGEHKDSSIPGLDSARAQCTSAGIYKSDVVLVPLEDGDRAEALRKMGKDVITIDLNPLSRTSRLCSITIVDNLVRALPKLIETIKELDTYDDIQLMEIKTSFDNNQNLKEMLNLINDRLGSMVFQSGI